MVVYYSAKNLFKTRQTQMPKYVYNMIATPFVVKTRMADTGGIRDVRKLKTGIANSTYIPRSINLWNSLPSLIKMEKSPSIFAGKLLLWVKANY